MRFQLKFVHAEGRHESAVETYAATRRAPMTLALSGTPEGMLVSVFIKPRATLLALGAAAAIAYVGAGLGLSWWFARAPHNRIHVADVMLPWRWSTLRDLRGQMFLAQGVEALRRGDYAPGFFLVRRGLASHPDDAASRLVLAEMLAKARDYEGVRQTVLPQLAFAPVPRPLLSVLITEALRVDDAATIAECGEQLATKPASAADHQWLQLRRASALTTLGRPADALTVLAEPAFELSGDAADLKVAALCALGRAPEAIALAEALPSAHAGEPQRRFRLLARAYRHAGKPAELAAALKDLIALDPNSVESRLFAIEQLWAGDRREEARRELDALLQRISAQTGAIAAVVARLGDDAAPPLIQRCIDEARALGQPVEPMLTTLAMSCVVAADWAGARKAFAAIFETGRRLTEVEMQARDCLRATIEAGATGAAKANAELKTALELNRLLLPSYLRTAAGLAQAGRWEAAQIVTEAALKYFPRSFELQRRATEAREKAAAIAKTAPKPPEATLPVANRGPDLSKLNAASFTARLNEHLERKEWDAAAELILAARRAEPEWFGAIAAELDWQEARVAFGRGDRLRVTQMIGFGLKRNRREVERALGFAREYRALGNRDAELALARKVIEIAPDSAAAQRYLAELEGK